MLKRIVMVAFVPMLSLAWAGNASAEPKKPVQVESQSGGKSDIGQKLQIQLNEANKSAPKRGTRHQANIKFGDVTLESSAKKKQTKKPNTRAGGQVQFEDVHVGKEVDKASPKLKATSGQPGGGKPLSGGLLDSQGGLGLTGPAAVGTPGAAGAPRGGAGGSAPGPVFR